MKKKLSFVMAMIALTFIFYGCNPAPPTGKIVLTKTQFAPNEEIKLTFSTEGKFGSNPWIGIIPSSIPHGDESKNDENDLSYQYFEGLASGEMEFNAPQEAGDYDFRMHTTDQDGIEVTSVSFKVVAPKLEATLRSNKQEYAPGEEIIVFFTASAGFPQNAWVGIIPSETPHGSEAVNDEADLAYEYLKQQTSGELKFTAPDRAGSYDIRMNDSDSDGKEVKSITIIVK